jgi:hypothetical protein
MKTKIAILIVALVSAGGALADNDVGCGVGTEVWKGQTGLGPKLAASFTNGLTFQSISVTFGLINCNGQDTVTADAGTLRLRHYASVNFDRLAEEMAMGGGQRLDAFAALLDIPATDRAEFAAFTQRNFSSLYDHDHVTVGEMLTSLDRLLTEDPALRAYARS